MLTQELKALGDLPNSHAVRALARDARRLISGGGHSMDAIELLARIDRMTEAWDHVPGAPILSWLKSLRRQLEAA